MSDFNRQAPTELVLVASERQAEHESARGARVCTLRELATRLVEAAHPEQREASREATRLLTRRLLGGRPLALALAVDDALGQLRRAGALAADLAHAGGARAALLADTLERASLRLAQLGLRDERENAWLAARAVSQASTTDLEGVLRARVRGVTQWDNGDLELLGALHETLRSRGGTGVVIELPAVRADLGEGLREAVSVLATRLELHWGGDGDHPEIEFVDAKPGSEPASVIQAAHEASEARAVARAVLDALA
ncbi:MAG TPA: hypothetical protein VGL19_20215, partial [Polyangiaceae bacterium]